MNVRKWTSSYCFNACDALNVSSPASCRGIVSCGAGVPVLSMCNDKQFWPLVATPQKHYRIRTAVLSKEPEEVNKRRM